MSGTDDAGKIQSSQTDTLPEISISVADYGTRSVVRVTGDVNWRTSPEVRTALLDLFENRHRQGVVLDLQGAAASTAPESPAWSKLGTQSVVCFGRGRAVTDGAEKDRLLRAMIGRYFAGWTAGVDYDAPPEEHLAGTTMVEIAIEEWSAKTRAGGPKGPRDADPDAPGTCGVADV